MTIKNDLVTDNAINAVDRFVMVSNLKALSNIAWFLLSEKNEEFSPTDVNRILKKSFAFIKSEKIEKEFAPFVDEKKLKKRAPLLEKKLQKVYAPLLEEKDRDLFDLLVIFEKLIYTVGNKDLHYSNRRIFDNFFDEKIIDQLLISKNRHYSFSDRGKIYLDLIVNNMLDSFDKIFNEYIDISEDVL